MSQIVVLCAGCQLNCAVLCLTLTAEQTRQELEAQHAEVLQMIHDTAARRDVLAGELSQVSYNCTVTTARHGQMLTHTMWLFVSGLSAIYSATSIGTSTGST